MTYLSASHLDARAEPAMIAVLDNIPEAALALNLPQIDQGQIHLKWKNTGVRTMLLLFTEHLLAPAPITTTCGAYSVGAIGTSQRSAGEEEGGENGVDLHD